MCFHIGEICHKNQKKKSQDKSLTSSNGSSSEIPIEFLPESSQFDESQEESQSEEHPSRPTSKEAQATTTSKAKAQDELKDQLNLVNSDLLALQKRKDCDMLSEEQESEFKKQKETKNGS
jgi:hypothetical protein